VTEEAGPGRVSVRLSPTQPGSANFFGAEDDNVLDADGLHATYGHAVRRLNDFPLAYVLFTEPRWHGGKYDNDVEKDPGPELKPPAVELLGGEEAKGEANGCPFKETAATAQGALKLDNYTFDKTIAIPGHSFLVKFDTSYAYGEKEDEFKTLCKLAHTVPSFFVGEVPVQEYGDKDNDDLRERFELKKEDFPVYFLFNEANSKGLKYTGAVKADEIAVWLRRNQIKMPAIGTIEELDAIAKKFLKEGLAEEHIKAAEALVNSQYSTDRKAGMYVKIMQKIKEKGEAYVAGETARVQKILAGKVTPEKASEMSDKLRILAVFSSKEEL